LAAKDKYLGQATFGNLLHVARFETQVGEEIVVLIIAV
jgi:hypothetical protein